MTTRRILSGKKRVETRVALELSHGVPYGVAPDIDGKTVNFELEVDAEAPL